MSIRMEPTSLRSDTSSEKVQGLRFSVFNSLLTRSVIFAVWIRSVCYLGAYRANHEIERNRWMVFITFLRRYEGGILFQR